MPLPNITCKVYTTKIHVLYYENSYFFYDSSLCTTLTPYTIL